MRYNIFLSLFLLLLSSCNTQNQEINQFTSSLSEFLPDFTLDKIDYVIIIPNQGCGGCITGAEEFYKENKERSNLIFIFTNIISQKILNQKVNISQNNTFLDTSNAILKAYHKGKSIYPCVLTVKNKIISEIEYQTPENDVFHKIKNVNYEVGAN